MYQGNNPAALRSRAMIVDAMFELLQTTAFNQINVRLLTNQAKVSRQTFYAIFETREEVIQCRLQAIFSEYQAALTRLPLNLHSLITLFFNFYQSHAELFNLLLDNQLENLLTQNARDCMATLKLSDGPTQPYINGFVAAGLTQLLSDWHNQQDVSIQALIDLTEGLLNPTVIQSRDSH